MMAGVHRGTVFVLLWLCLVVTGSLPASSGQATNPNASGAQDQGQSSSKDAKDKKDADSATTKLKIVLLGSNDKPIGNASVYVRFYLSGGFLHHDKMTEMNFRTNEDGSVKVPPVPQGKILIQVIATGWKTYGKWYDVEQGEETIQIKLEPPPHWY